MAIPKPKANETQTAFASRAHEALAEKYPNTDERNAVVFSLWRESGRDKLERLANETFPPERFERVEDVAVFCEHEKKKRRADGSEFVETYDKEALEKIVARCNSRISDTKNFARLVEGHTPDPEEAAAGAKQPAVLGFEGPYFLGMCGNDEPRWAIYSNEYWLKDRAHKRAELPGRSVELWMHDDMAERFFDPIAALGAETPRLDLPIKYQLLAGRRVAVERYSAFPGEGNTTAPAFNAPAKKERFQMMSPEEIQQMSQAISQAVVAAIMEALSAPAAAPPGADPAAAAGAPPAGGAPAAPPPAGGPPKPPGPEDQNAADEIDDDEECDDEDYSADEIDDADSGEDVDGIDKKKESKMPTKMSKKLADLELEVARFRRKEAEFDKTREHVATLTRDKVKAERHSKLAELQSEGYRFRDEVKDGHVVKSGLAREVDRCATMSEEQFQAHCVGIIENYSKVDPPARPLRTFPMNDIQGESEEVAKACAVEARDRVAKFRKEGKRDVSFPSVLNEVRKEKGLSAIA
jgi:hypothetical protein